MKYIKELDALRGLAILSVLVSHWFPKTTFLYKLTETINAPNIFFTISGFLITKILLTERADAEQRQYSKFLVVRNFIFKRALRIFPAYYFLLLLAYLPSRMEPINFMPYLTFTANFHIYATKIWGPISHLWTMAVEEQFYILWPLLILFLNRKLLPYGILAFFLAGVISRHLLPDNEFSQILTITCFDALALGGLLAWAITSHKNRLSDIYLLLSVVGTISLLLFIKNALFDIESSRLYNRTLTALMVLWLLVYFIKRSSGARPLLLFNSKVLRTVGQMSYGIYLYHAVLPFFSYRILYYVNRHLPLAVQKNAYFYMSEVFILLICVSWLSWKFFEMPLVNLKRHIRRPRGRKNILPDDRTGEIPVPSIVH